MLDWLQTNAIALIALVVAIASVGVQIGLERQRRSTRIEVRLERFLTVPEMQAARGIKVINRSDHQIRIDSAGFDLGSGQTISIISPPAGATIPGVVAPRDSARTWLTVEDYVRTGIDRLRMDATELLIVRPLIL